MKTTTALCILCVPLLGGCASGSTSYNTLTTRRLELVNDAGVVLARLGVDDDGSAGLFLLDADGRTRATLIHDERQTALYLLDDEGTTRVGVAQFAHGGGGLAIHGTSSQGAAVLYMQDNAGSLRFFDDEGTVLQQLPGSTASPAQGEDR